MRGRPLANFGETPPETCRALDRDALAPGHEVPAHLVDPVRAEAHGDGAVLVPVAGLGRVEQSVPGVVRRLLDEAARPRRAPSETSRMTAPRNFAGRTPGCVRRSPPGTGRRAPCRVARAAARPSSRSGRRGTPRFPSSTPPESCTLASGRDGGRLEQTATGPSPPTSGIRLAWAGSVLRRARSAAFRPGAPVRRALRGHRPSGVPPRSLPG